MIEPSQLTAHALIVAVLWMHGDKTARIASASGWTPGKVRGFVHRQFPKPRQNMTMEERELALAVLAEFRAKAPRLRDEHFLPKMIKVLPVRPAEKVVAPPLPDMRTRAGRREARRRQREAEHAAQKQLEDREARERGNATRRGELASALDFASSRGYLADPSDRGVLTKAGGSSGQRRLEAAQRFRAYLDGTRIGSLGAIDYETATMGAGGGPKLTLSAYKLQCVHALGWVKQASTASGYRLMESVIDRDEFVWDRFEAGSSERARLFEALRLNLDIVAVHERLLTPEGLSERWGLELPQARGQSRLGAVDQAAAAAEIFAAAR